MKKSRAEAAVDIVNYAFLAILNVVVLYPFYYAVINSINVNILYGPALVWPSEASLYPYKMILQNPLIPSALLITVLRTIVWICCQFAEQWMREVSDELVTE